MPPLSLIGSTAQIKHGAQLGGDARRIEVEDLATVVKADVVKALGARERIDVGDGVTFVGKLGSPVVQARQALRDQAQVLAAVGVAAVGLADDAGQGIQGALQPAARPLGTEVLARGEYSQSEFFHDFSSQVTGAG